MKNVDKIPSRVKYYLLDYNDRNMEDFLSIFGSKRLNELTLDELKRYFALATAKDLGKFLNEAAVSEENKCELCGSYKEAKQLGICDDCKGLISTA